jgi:hypothetical protein
MNNGAETIKLLQRLPWPIIILDFEASALGRESYPIEAGICRWTSSDAALEGWSALICPAIEWSGHGIWSPQSAEIHKISRSDLVGGLTPTSTMHMLNQLIGNGYAWCDGGEDDAYWLQRLVAHTGVNPTFQLKDWDMLTGVLDMAGYDRMVAWLDRSKIRHRARDDAENLLRALAIGLEVEHGSSIDIELVSLSSGD